MLRSLLLLVVSVSLLGAGCGDDGVEPATETTRPSQSNAAAPEPNGVSPKVDLRDVAYGCGPTDGTGIGFEAASSEPLLVRAELVVDGRSYGSTEDIEIGTTPTAMTPGWIEISLTTEAYEKGEGEVRVLASDGGELVASAPVVLRLAEGGGCG